jgi:hypothetical protein
MKVRSTTTSGDCIGELYQLMLRYFVQLTVQEGLNSKGIGGIRAECPATLVES